MDKDFNLQFIEHAVYTQYNDCRGFTSIDGHNGPTDLSKMCEDYGIDLSSNFIYGIVLYDSEPIGRNKPIGMDEVGVNCDVYLIDKSTYGHSFDEISNYDGTIELIKKSITMKYSDFHRYIKRLSIGVVTPISSKCNVSFPEEEL